MSIRVMTAVFDVEGLTPSEKVVALAYADHAHDDGTEAKIGIERAMTKTALSRRTVQMTLRSLESKGVIAVQRPATNKLPVCYRFLLTPDQRSLAFRGAESAPQGCAGGASDAPGGASDDILGRSDDALTIRETSDKPKSRVKGAQDYTPEFEDWWKIYPKPVDKRGTFGCWNATLRERGGTVESLMLAASLFASQMIEEGREKRHILNSTTFLGPGERWREFLPEEFSDETLEQAQAWDAYDSSDGSGPEPDFPRPQDSSGNLLDGQGLAYYIDEYDFRRRYLHDE